ncbi:hypothetical protein Cs7R123_16930 [Catellatospora sp. TT07R-123]|nr:hypothetical protein Cs7R123_16930 [Catellatospora sp. TT07R-123]
MCHVRRHLPIAEIVVAGTLDDSTVIHVGVALSDCLADQPDAVVLDLAGVRCVDERLAAWLRGMAQTARHWPGAPLLVAASAVRLPADDGITAYDDAEAALAAAAALPVAPRRTVTLPPLPSSCGTARDLAGQACQDFGVPRLAQLVRLLASELTANAVVHARTELRLTVRRTAAGVDLAVRDRDPFLPQAPGPDDRGGGLELVSALAGSWGSMLTSDGKVVWARTGPAA